jgi:hypothetical protein
MNGIGVVTKILLTRLDPQSFRDLEEVGSLGLSDDVGERLHSVFLRFKVQTWPHFGIGRFI